MGQFTWRPSFVLLLQWCRRHEFATQSLLCNSQHFYIVYTDMWFNNTYKIHFYVSIETMVTRTCHNVTYLHCLTCLICCCCCCVIALLFLFVLPILLMLLMPYCLLTSCSRYYYYYYYYLTIVLHILSVTWRTICRHLFSVFVVYYCTCFLVRQAAVSVIGLLGVVPEH